MIFEIVHGFKNVGASHRAKDTMLSRYTGCAHQLHVNSATTL